LYAVVELRKKNWGVGGRHRGAEVAETSTPCVTWGPQPQYGEIPVPPQFEHWLCAVNRTL